MFDEGFDFAAFLQTVFWHIYDGEHASKQITKASSSGQF